MRKVSKILVVIGSIFFIITFSFNAWLQNKHVVPIIMYHSVDNPRHFSGVIVSPKNFRKQMEFLRKHHYHVISLDELITDMRTKKEPPHNSVVITFDDGYVDNYTQAFPILKEYGFPAIIFMITDLIGKEGYLTLNQMREMEKSKISFGSHTVSHVHLPGVPLNWQEYQIKESKRVLEEKLGHRIDYLAYPSGGFSDGTKDIVEQVGYKAACTTNRGNRRFNEDLYELKRVRFSNKDYEMSMWGKLSGYYNLFRVLRDPN